MYVFARNTGERDFARELGAAWAGDTSDQPPERMAAIIDTTPAWKPVVSALERLLPGGRLVINAIRKSRADQGELESLDYARHLTRVKWGVAAKRLRRRARQGQSANTTSPGPLNAAYMSSSNVR